MTDDLSDILERIASGEYSEADITALQQALKGEEGRSLFQLGKYNITIGAGKDIQIGDRTFVEINDAAVQAIIEAIQNGAAPKTPAQIDFQPYLRSLVDTYKEWWRYYTPTDATGKIQKSESESPSPFDFGLMVQTVSKEKDLAAPETNRRPEPQEKTERLPVLEGIRKYANDHVLLVGRPGSGKSTALIRMLLEMATQALEHGSGKIPILVELRYWQTSVTNRIQAFLHKHDPTLSLDDSILSSLLRQGHFLLLVDGLNELPSETARTQLASFRQDYSQVPMIFTTRDLGLGGDLGIEKQLAMQPLTEGQMQVFIRAYVPDQAETMLRQLSDRLREFGQTPLLLWMLCEVFQQSPEHQIPSNLAGIFQIFTSTYEESSVRKHEVALLKGDVRPLSDRRLWKPALKALAAAMMQGETSVDFRVAIHRDEAEQELSRIFSDEQFPVRDILDDLLKYHLLQNRSADQIEFRHQLIQEYYAAEYLLKLLPNLSDEQLKRDYLNLLKWTEPIALMLALVNEEDQALRVVKLALDEVDLLLGARLAGEVSSHHQEKTVGLIVQKEFPQWLEVELLGESKTEVAKQHLLQYLSHPNIELVRKAAAFIGETSNQETIESIFCRLQAIDAQFFTQKVFGGSDQTGGLWTAYVESLAHLSSNRAVAFLRKKLLNGEVINYDSRLHYHTDAAQLLTYLDAKAFLPILIKNLEKTQAESQQPFTPDESEDSAESDFFRYIPIEKRREGAFNNQKSILLSFTKGLNEPDLVNSILTTALEREGSPSTKVEMIRLLRDGNGERVDQLLIELLSDENFKVQKEACSKLISRNTNQIEQLEQLLKHSDIKISWAAAFVLGSLGHTIAFPVLAEVIKTKDLKYLEMQRYTAQLLGSFNPDTAAPVLMEILTDESRNSEFKTFVRPEATHSLAEIGYQEAVPNLLEELRSGFRNYTRDNIRSLAKLGLEQELWTILRDRELAWQTAAVELSKLGHSQVLPDLCQALISFETEPANNVISAVNKLADLDTLDWLLDALRNPSQYKTDRYFLNRVAFVLVGCDILLLEKRLQSLIEIAQSQYVEHLFWIIPNIQNRCKFYNYEIFHGIIPQGKTIGSSVLVMLIRCCKWLKALREKVYAK